MVLVALCNRSWVMGEVCEVRLRSTINYFTRCRSYFIIEDFLFRNIIEGERKLERSETVFVSYKLSTILLLLLLLFIYFFKSRETNPCDELCETS